MTPLAAVLGGIVAGAVGTVCLDTVEYLRYRRGGGKESPLAWEFAPVDSWDEAPVPRQVAKRVIEGFTRRPLPDRWAFLTSTATHRGYGSAWGAVYGVVAGSLPVWKKEHYASGATAWINDLRRPPGERAVPADLEVRREDAGRAPRVRRGHRSSFPAAREDRLGTSQTGPAGIWSSLIA